MLEKIASLDIYLRLPYIPLMPDFYFLKSTFYVKILTIMNIAPLSNPKDFVPQDPIVPEQPQQAPGKIDYIKKWLGTGSINIFGLPMSGKDTVGQRLAEALGAVFLSSGLILRTVEEQTKEKLTESGQLTPTDRFREIVLPYFSSPELNGKSLVLSSIGRWYGEEDAVMEAAENGNHEIKAVISLDISEQDVRDRWQSAKVLNDRGGRTDDERPEVFETRLNEFKDKTLPVLTHYNSLNKLVRVKADATRDAVFESTIDALYDFAMRDLVAQEQARQADAALANGHNGNRR